MKFTNLVLALVCCLVAWSAQAQDYQDRFAYSYGLILGDNIKKLGFTTETFPEAEMMDGLRAFYKEKDFKAAEKAAQTELNAALVELNALKSDGKALNTMDAAKLGKMAADYGKLIAANWNIFGIEIKDVSMDDFKKGFRAMIGTKGKTALTVEEAQSEVNAKFQLMMQEKEEKQVASNQEFLDENKKKAAMQSLKSGIQYQVLKAGTGAQPNAKSTVTTHYHGTLLDGTVFDSSIDRGEPISFNLSGVIKGWQEIIPMMKTGGKWRVYIPSYLAYGNRKRAKIPANSLLIFEIELISVDN